MISTLAPAIFIDFTSCILLSFCFALPVLHLVGVADFRGHICIRSISSFIKVTSWQLPASVMAPEIENSILMKMKSEYLHICSQLKF
jgi:hypothetical protein